MTHIEILATGPELITKGIRGIESVVEDLIREAKSEIQIITYVFTAKAIRILTLVEKAAERGVSITIVVNKLEVHNLVIRTKLKSITEKFPYVKIYTFADLGGKQLHAKILVVDRKKAVVGSANYTWGGMVSNYEVGLLVEGPGVWSLAQIADIITTLSKSV